MKRLTLAPNATSRARNLRRNMTTSERQLWRALRETLPHFHWRKQVPFGRYIVDFCSHGARLIIEVDGGQHAEAQEFDAARTLFLEREGYRVLRFWNNDILSNMRGVLDRIASELPLAASKLAQ